jgi:very-short-patch-repair endonuclease
LANQTARALRKRMTPQEVKLWVQLRAMKGPGYHFRRQAPIDQFIVDFVCFKQRLIIEVDGGQHGRYYQQANDAKRDAYLSAAGFRVCASGISMSTETLSVSATPYWPPCSLPHRPLAIRAR